MRAFDFCWVPVGGGRMALWHRPKLRAIPFLGNAGCDRVVTLLSEREGGAEIGRAVEATGLGWTWIPLASGRPPEGAPGRRAQAALALVLTRLAAGESIVMHCSAGMHRTGMMAYALLRRGGLEQEPALELIERMRRVTRHALTPAHLAWGEQAVLREDR